MRLRKLHLKAFGPFTDRVLDFGTQAQGLVLVHGLNEAGKSSALRAISDLRFGMHPQSSDNFVHSHPEMRIGGEFVDRQGKQYSLIRRKGRGATLLLADFSSGAESEGEPAPPEVEALLACGLTKDAYDAMFGLDHRRLREGGEALLKGEGEIGAALFEASAGVRSIPQVLARLDESARRFFMPGARGKRARINEALIAYEERHGAFRQAQVRPMQWTEMFKSHAKAANDLEDIETRRVELNGKILLTRELRAVAPLLSTLDTAAQTLEGLKSVPLLATTATADRAAAETGVTDAQHNASVAAEEARRQQKRLDELKLDTKILKMESAVKRIAASAEAIDQHRRDIADATVDVDAQAEQVRVLAGRINASLTPDEVGKMAPAKVEAAEIERLLRAIEQADQGLDQHLEVGRQVDDAQELAVVALPPDEARTALRIAQEEVGRSDVDLKRLAVLPGEMKASQRAVAAALKAIELEEEAALLRIRPVLDAQIDGALREESVHAARRNGLSERIAAISNAIPAAMERRALLLQEGDVATRDQVAASRSHRDRGWALVRGTYIDGTKPAVDDYAGARPLEQVYENAVVHADHLVDDLAGDTERAAQLQAANREIETLERDRDALKGQFEEAEREEAERLKLWGNTLADRNLPALSPAALRDWQALLPAVHRTIENRQAKVDEIDRVQAVERDLAARLRAAISGTGLATPAPEALLSTLRATAAQIDETILQNEATNNKAAGKELERQRQQKQRAERESELKIALNVAKEAAKPALASLLLPDDIIVAAARARMGEFVDLVEVKARLAEAQTRRRRAEKALSVLKESVLEVGRSLGDPEPTELRLYIEQLWARLQTADETRAARALAVQSLENAEKSQREHEDTATRHKRTIEGLCLAAGVELAEQLPEAEEQSRRKRSGQDEVDRSRTQLASASRRTADELRALLLGLDAVQMDADEGSFAQQLARIDEQIPGAREREEQSRRELEAIDGSDVAATAREAMERAAATVRSNMSPWIRSRIAHALLAEALKRFRDRAQGPMLKAASAYFEQMTRGEFVRLLSDDAGKDPVLIAQRNSGNRIHVEEMSEGTLDQLYLALRLAALDIRRASGVDLPVVLDDVLMTSDEERTGAILETLANFAQQSQVIVFTHHRHVADVAKRHVSDGTLVLVEL